MGALSPTHWLIIVGVLVVLFGAKRLPDAARSLGRSARILKSEVHELREDEQPATAPAPQAVAASTTPAAAAPSTTRIADAAGA